MQWKIPVILGQFNNWNHIHKVDWCITLSISTLRCSHVMANLSHEIDNLDAFTHGKNDYFAIHHNFDACHAFSVQYTHAHTHTLSLALYVSRIFVENFLFLSQTCRREVGAGVGVCLSSTPHPLYRTTKIANYFRFEANIVIATGMHSVHHRRPHSHSYQQSETLEETSLLRPLAHVSIIRVFYIECTLISNARCILHLQQPLQCHHWRQTDNNNRTVSRQTCEPYKDIPFRPPIFDFPFLLHGFGYFWHGSIFVCYWSEPTENGGRYYSYIFYQRPFSFDLFRKYYAFRCLGFCICIFFFFGSFIASLVYFPITHSFRRLMNDILKRKKEKNPILFCRE